MAKRDVREIERILSAETYGSAEEAVAAARAMAEPGDEIRIHAADCEIDTATDEGCTCEPISVVHRSEIARA